MPTARELLEQADALMRRNRAAALDDIPVLTDSVPMMEDRLPLARPPAAPVPPPATPAPAGIPTLTVRAPPGGPHEPPDSMLREGGEPSDWLEIEGGEPSVVGEAPDSVAIVPPVERVRVADEVLLMAAEHEEIELTTPAEDAFDDEFAPRESPRDVVPESREDVRDADAPADAWADAGEPEPAAQSAFASASAPDAATEPLADDGVPEALAAPSPEPAADRAPDSTAPPGPGAAALPAWSTPAVPLPPPVLPAWSPQVESPAPVWTPPIAAPAPPPVAHPVIAEPEPATPAASAADDQAKWDAIAEEVRVQVLQRIDLFTDTGLRDQLGLRLKPIVERASADLIATISLNVGELLRGYVAEAIEREIESWRRDH